MKDEDRLTVLSQAGRTRWKNLRGGAPVTIRVRGKNWIGTAETFEDPEAVTDGLLALLQGLPALQKYFGVHVPAQGHPEKTAALARLAQDKVIVRVILHNTK